MVEIPEGMVKRVLKDYCSKMSPSSVLIQYFEVLHVAAKTYY